MKKNKLILFSFIILILVCVTLVNIVSEINTAKRFDSIHFNMLIVMICLSSFFVKYEKFKELFIKNFIYSTVFAVASIIAYNLYDSNDKYFSFEMESYSWSGGINYLRVMFYIIIALAFGMVVWWLKQKTTIKINHMRNVG